MVSLPDSTGPWETSQKCVPKRPAKPLTTRPLGKNVKFSLPTCLEPGEHPTKPYSVQFWQFCLDFAWTAFMGMKTGDIYGMTVPGPRIEWSEVKDRVSLEMVATNLLGPARQRRGNAYSGRVRSMMTMTQASRLM